jgi:hypothetical protein
MIFETVSLFADHVAHKFASRDALQSFDDHAILKVFSDAVLFTQRIVHDQVHHQWIESQRSTIFRIDREIILVLQNMSLYPHCHRIE